MVSYRLWTWILIIAIVVLIIGIITYERNNANVGGAPSWVWIILFTGLFLLLFSAIMYAVQASGETKARRLREMEEESRGRVYMEKVNSDYNNADSTSQHLKMTTLKRTSVVSGSHDSHLNPSKSVQRDNNVTSTPNYRVALSTEDVEPLDDVDFGDVSLRRTNNPSRNYSTVTESQRLQSDNDVQLDKPIRSATYNVMSAPTPTRKSLSIRSE